MKFGLGEFYFNDINPVHPRNPVILSSLPRRAGTHTTDRTKTIVNVEILLAVASGGSHAQSHGEETPQTAARLALSRANRTIDTSNPRPAGDDRLGFGPALRGQHFQAERTSRQKPGTVSGRLFVSPYLARVYRLEIANCDIKFGARRPADAAAGLYGAWGRDAFERPPLADGGERQHRDHADLRPLAAFVGDAG